MKPKSKTAVSKKKKPGKAKPTAVQVGAVKVTGPKVTKRNGVAVIHPAPKGHNAEPAGQFEIHDAKAPPKPAVRRKSKKAYGVKTLKPVSQISAVQPVDGAVFLGLHRASLSAGVVEGRPPRILLIRGAMMSLAVPVRATGGDDLLVQCRGRFHRSMKMSTTLLQGNDRRPQSSATFDNVTDELQFVVAGNPSTMGTLRIAFGSNTNAPAWIDGCTITRL